MKTLTTEQDADDRRRIELVYAELRSIADAEMATLDPDDPWATFMGWPDRWWDTFLRRCANDHVSRMTVKSEALGRDVCIACGGRVTMTFPEDRDGPLIAPTGE